MDIEKGVVTILSFFAKVFGNPAKVTALTKTESGWKAEVEMVEEAEYMRIHGKDELLGVYELELSSEFEVLGYKRTGFRERAKPFMIAREEE